MGTRMRRSLQHGRRRTGRRGRWAREDQLHRLGGGEP
uniref:Uncharacterized protein n=1 Tax=Arundo donax TaxID=35708 RepID=A0A0A8YHE6_ARUDO